MALFNEKRNRVPVEVVVPTNGTGIRGQLRMLDNSTDTNLYVCTTESSLTDPYTQATLTTTNGANIEYTAKAHGVAGDSVTVEHLTTSANQDLVVSVLSNALTVELETNSSGASISSAAHVAAAVNALDDNIIVSAIVGTSKGTVLPETSANLSGGVNSDAVWIVHAL